MINDEWEEEDDGDNDDWEDKLCLNLPLRFRKLDIYTP